MALDVPQLAPLSPAEREALADLRIMVLYGGPGAEREVSLESGRAVYDALRVDGRRVTLHDIRNADDVARLDGDVAILMLHGEFGEDGQIQALLEARGLPFAGSSAEVSAVTMDKDATKRLLAAARIPVAAWGMIRPGQGGALALTTAWRRAGGAFPVMVKPNARGSSVGMTLVRGFDALDGAVAKALEFDPEGAMIEAYVAGREFTAGRLGDDALPLIELKAAVEFYDYDAKYRSDETRYQCPAPLDPDDAARYTDLAARVAATLGVRDLARVDVLVGALGPVVLEINTAPGFTAHSLVPMAARAVGLSLADIAWRLVHSAVIRNKNAGLS